MGLLEHPKKRNSILAGNLILIQIQAILVGFLAGIFSCLLGGIVHKGFNSLNETLLMIASSILTACCSSLLMSSLMAGIVLLSKKIGVDPDNISTPLAASIGDLVTLFFLAAFSQFLFNHISIFALTVRLSDFSHPDFRCNHRCPSIARICQRQ